MASLALRGFRAYGLSADKANVRGLDLFNGFMAICGNQAALLMPQVDHGVTWV